MTTAATTTTTTYTVSGMTCQHCVRSVSEEISAIGGVTDVVVDLPAGTVTVASRLPLDDGRVRAAVEEAGYELTS